MSIPARMRRGTNANMTNVSCQEAENEIIRPPTVVTTVATNNPSCAVVA